MVIGPVTHPALFIVSDVKFIEEDLDLVVAFGIVKIYIPNYNILNLLNPYWE